MAEIIRTGQGIEPGDVLLVKQELRDKKTQEPYTWRWYGVVMSLNRTRILRVLRIGRAEDEGYRTIDLASNRHEVTWLDPDEWPDGVHALRMKMILTGEIDIA